MVAADPSVVCTLQTCPLSDAIITYLPNLGGNVLYAVIFAVILVGQLVLGIRYRTWGFLGGMVSGLLLEILGYAGRIWYRYHPFGQSAFLMYLVCLTIAPAFLSASIYLCLGRLISVEGRQVSRLTPRAETRIFIASDILALVLQAAGGAISSLATTNSFTWVGIHIMVAGLAWQVLSLAVFMVLWLELAIKASKVDESEKPSTFAELRAARKFKLFQIALALSTVLITIRSIYRVVELAGGFQSSLAENQPLFMVFEGVMIILATTLLTVFHPGLVFKGAWKGAMLSSQEKSADGGESWTPVNNSNERLHQNVEMKYADPRTGSS